MRRIATLGLCVGLVVLARPGPVWAPFHLVLIEEVFFGSQDCPDAQYVKLRTFAAGQTLVFGQHVRTQLADGTEVEEFGAFTKNLNNSQNGVAMLMGTAAAEGLFGIPFDEVVTGELVQPDGRVCFGIFGPPVAPVDCVAYGDYTGDNGTGGAPTVAPVPGMALVRISDTNDDATDFELAEPMPENNNGDIGVLGECPQTATCVGDCDGDGSVTVDEIVRGVNIALGMSPVDDCPALDADGSESVTVDEVVTAVNNALNGCDG